MADIRMKGFPQRTTVVDAWKWIDQHVLILSTEEITIQAAGWRILAQDIVSLVDIPSFLRSAMDGYAVRAEDTYGADSYNPIRLVQVGSAFPAVPFSGTIQPGQCVSIMTGSPLPAGADAVVPAEVTKKDQSHIEIQEAVSPWRHVGRIGEDVHVGQKLLSSTRCLRPQDLGILAAMGVTKISVIQKPTVALFITGNELLPVGSKPSGFQIVDSNSIMLTQLIERDGGQALPAVYVHDDPEVIRSALQTVEADLILFSGGTSVGIEDHVPQLIQQMGHLPIHGLALRPASPTGMGLINNKPVFLLPGNPVSCLCAYDLLAGRAIRKQAGRALALPYRSQTVPLTNKIVSALGRMDYVRVRRQENGVEPLAVRGASMLSTTVLADGFVLVDPELEGYAAGQIVTIYWYDAVS